MVSMARPQRREPAMRGSEPQQMALFSVVSLDDRIPQDHPLRAMRPLVDRALATLSPTFDQIYADGGRPSITPEHLLRALLLQVLYTVRSERQLMEQLAYNLLFRWFVGLGIDDAIWDVTVFTKNRERLLIGDVAEGFFAAVLAEAKTAGLLSPEHFTVDGTLIQAWAGQKSFRLDPAKAEPAVPKHRRKFLPPDDPRRDPPADGTRNPTVNSHGERRSNSARPSTAAPQQQLARKAKGREAQLAYQATLLMENRCGLAVGTCLTAATGTAERDN